MKANFHSLNSTYNLCALKNLQFRFTHVPTSMFYKFISFLHYLSKSPSCNSLATSIPLTYCIQIFLVALWGLFSLLSTPKIVLVFYCQLLFLNMYAHAHARTHTHTHTQTHRNTHRNTDTHTYTHTYTQTHTHRQTHT